MVSTVCVAQDSSLQNKGVVKITRYKTREEKKIKESNKIEKMIFCVNGRTIGPLANLSFSFVIYNCSANLFPSLR